jgi:hypothetical protein
MSWTARTPRARGALSAPGQRATSASSAHGRRSPGTSRRGTLVDVSDKVAVLRDLTFGQRVAEEEGDVLKDYFVETDQWRRIFDGEVDVVYGAKGAGKSAIFALLQARRTELAARNIIVIAADNARGNTFSRISSPILRRASVNSFCCGSSTPCC